jgi:D-alanyl-D-alanine carboxypeptidase (penicillin-binding protein 5/6)
MTPPFGEDPTVPLVYEIGNSLSSCVKTIRVLNSLKTMRSFILILFVWVCTLAAKPLQVEVKAGSAVLMNADTGAVLYEKRGFSPIYPASTTKIATALFILSEKEPNFDQMMKVSAESLRMRPPNKNGTYPAYWWYADGTRMG